MNYVSFEPRIFNINFIIWSETFLSGEKIEGIWCCHLRAQVLREAPSKLKSSSRDSDHAGHYEVAPEVNLCMQMRDPY